MFYEIRERYARWRLYRQTARRLRDLDNHILADVGIERADIACWAREATERAVWIR
jgi:uncharacterized protein YjiS (DUF1127 family)